MRYSTEYEEPSIKNGLIVVIIWLVVTVSLGIWAL